MSQQNNETKNGTTTKNETTTKDIAIGIDLGTTYSCVAVYKNGQVEIIANEQGNRTMPSIVSFQQKEIMVGESAKNQASRNPTNTIYDVKRLMGRKMDDQVLQKEQKNLIYKVVDKDGRPQVKIQTSKEGGSIEEKLYTPEQISALILSKMKKIAEQYLGREVKKAVITVPAYFNDAQRQATKDAGTISGLDVLRIISEPTAAAMAYGFQDKNKKEQKIIIFDLGGGTFDVTVLTIDDGMFEVKSTSGDTHLGGEDFDWKMIEYCAKEFCKKNNVAYNDFLANKKSLTRLKHQCEQAKRILSSAAQTNIEIDSLYDGNDFSITITRSKFEELCMDLFKKCLVSVEQALKDSGFAKNQINHIVMVGGSSRIPKVQQLLSDYFGGKQLNNSINPDESVAYGAAIQAQILVGGKDQPDENITSILLVDVTPLSLGIETAGGIMTNIVDRNTTIPCKKFQTFSTYQDNQPAVTIKIYEGERKFVKDNRLLGQFDLSGIQPAPRGVPKIEITFDLDENGILNVTAVEKSSGTKNIQIKRSKENLSKADIEEAIKQAQEHEEQDRILAEKIQAKNEFEGLYYNVKNKLQTNKDKLQPEQATKIQEKLDECSSLISQDLSKEDSNKHREELLSIAMPLLQLDQGPGGPTQGGGFGQGGFGQGGFGQGGPTQGGPGGNFDFSQFMNNPEMKKQFDEFQKDPEKMKQFQEMMGGMGQNKQQKNPNVDEVD